MKQYRQNFNVRRGVAPLVLLSLATFTVSAQTSSTHSHAETTQADSRKMVTTKIGSDLYLLAGPSGNGNVVLSVGNDGVFIIDDQTPQMTESLNAAIKDISKKKVRYVLNTHWHFDHTGNNEQFGKHEATIIAHKNVRTRLSSPQKVFGYDIPASPTLALPVITYDKDIHIHLNDKNIDAVYFPHAHSNSDSIFFFKDENIVHMGDIFIHKTYPFFDLANGGSVQGALKAIDIVLDRINDKTIIVPGHGPLANKADLIFYRDLLRSTLKTVTQLKNDGTSLESIIKLNLVEQHNKVWDGGMISSAYFITEMYQSLEF